MTQTVLDTLLALPGRRLPVDRADAERIVDALLREIRDRSYRVEGTLPRSWSEDLAEMERLRGALRLAVAGFQQLIDPDPQRGILTNVRQQGEEQGIDLSLTFNAVVDLIAVLRAELGESDEGIEHLTERLQANSVAQQFVAMKERAEKAEAELERQAAR